MKKIILALVFLSVGYVYGQDNYQIKNLKVNTKYSDFGVSYYGKKAVYASSKPQNNKSRKNWTNGQPYLDLYKGLITSSGEIVDSKPFSDKIDTKYHESNAIFTKDLKTVYFTRNNYYNGKYGKDRKGWNNLKLFRATITKSGDWTNITPMPFNDDNYSVGHPALSPDEQTLYFVSDMPGSMGGTDIYKVSINSNGSYGTPINLGSKINTDGKEMFPYVSKKGNLYFSSDGRGGLGGLDVFVVPLNSKKARPKNLGFPINSPKDDFAFVINDDKKNGYFSSNREGGKGDDDIYYFKQLNGDDLACSQVISGTVRDKQNGALIPGAMVSLYKGSVKLESVIVGPDARFSFPNMDCGTNYKVVGEKSNYNKSEESITTTEEIGLELGLDLSLQPKANSGAISTTQYQPHNNEYFDRCQYALDNINTIYFDLDKHYIRPDAALELEKVVKVMKRCSDIKVEVRSHTDSRASDRYNMILSQKRAKSTVDYIVSRGISRDRLTAKGYGETQLLNRCSNGVKCSEAEHQVNRRTEFIIER